MSPIAETYPLLVAGQSVPAANGATFADINPSTGDLLATVSDAGPEDIERALSAASLSYSDGRWSSVSATDRGRILARASLLMAERAEEFAVADALDAGKPIGDARAGVAAAVAALEYYAGAANKWFGEVIPVPADGIEIVLREPVGVCALITPWNFPLVIATWKAAPALACGNPIVLKPSPLAPLTTLMLGSLLVEAGVPPECVSVLPGGGVVGEQLVGDPRVSKVSFTGSTDTGVAILQTAAPHITRVSLELGGKSACIVFADADIEECARSTAQAVFGHAGQDCCARSRILVEESIHEQFLSSLVRCAETMSLGDALSEQTEIGPLISSAQRERVQAFVAEAESSGASVVTGGGPPSADGTQSGYFFAPTVITNVDNGMRISQEEVFGPVVAVMSFKTEAEAVAIANDVKYGLSGSVWTRDIGRALRVVRGIHAGALAVNSNSSVFVEAPFGGSKASGLGRALGMHALELYTEMKSVFISTE